MSDHHSWFFTSWILVCLTFCKCSGITVQTFEGQSVTLPCKYDSKYHGKCYICWMRGDIPLNGCGDEIISSDGDTVVSRKSARYQLFGETEHGDVSLTIVNVQREDSGEYGCRIHVPGWFNDEKNYVNLIVNDAPAPTTQETTPMTSSSTEHETTGVITTYTTTEAPIPTTQESTAVTIQRTSQATHTAVDGTTQENTSNASESITAGLWTSDTTHGNSGRQRSKEHTDNLNTSAVLVPVLLLLLALIVLAALLIWKQKRKSRAMVEIVQESDNSVIYSNSGSSLGLYNREVAVDNVYQIETESEYEQWH